MKLNKLILPLILGAILVSCTNVNPKEKDQYKTQKYVGYFKSDSISIPFRFIWREGDSSNQWFFLNADQKDSNSTWAMGLDGAGVDFPIYNKRMSVHGEFGADLNGNLYVFDKDSSVYQTWTAKPVKEFDKSLEMNSKLLGDWVFAFEQTDKVTLALGSVSEYQGKIKGSVRKETGDLRFLEGLAYEDSLYLSTFDGGFMYLLTGKLIGDTIYGDYYSGRSYHTQWKAYKDDSFTLRDADKIAYFEGNEISFELLDRRFKRLKSSEVLGKNKVNIIQISGSWCANCIDETVYFNELTEQYASTDLAVTGVFFERFKDSTKAYRGIDGLSQTLSLNYPLYLGAKLGVSPEEVFKGLKNFSSYPTAIVLNKKGNVVYVHTGFSGPGTGVHYENYKKAFEKMLNELIQE